MPQLENHPQITETSRGIIGPTRQQLNERYRSFSAEVARNCRQYYGYQIKVIDGRWYVMRSKGKP